MTHDQRNDPAGQKSRASLDEPEPVDAKKPVLVAPDGRPARIPKSALCPQCGASPEQRISSSGFGRNAIDICKLCGYRFPG